MMPLSAIAGYWREVEKGEEVMPTETGPVTAEMVRDAVHDLHLQKSDPIPVDKIARAINSVLAPIIAAERALAGAEMREQCARVSDGLSANWGGTWNPHIDAAIRVRALPIPDEADLRRLVEWSLQLGYSQGMTKAFCPSPESVLRDYIERSRAKILQAIAADFAIENPTQGETPKP